MKKESALKGKIKELKKTTRGKAILKLIRWGIFFFFLFLFCIIASLISTNSPRKEENKPNEELVVKKLQENTLKSNFDYEYKIMQVKTTTIYKGTKNGSSESGYKETEEGIIKYKKDESGIYQETPTESIPISNLYDNLNEKYLDFNSLNNIISSLTFAKDRNGYYSSVSNQVTYILEFNNPKELEKTSISKITIKDNDSTYELNISNLKENK